MMDRARLFGELMSAGMRYRMRRLTGIPCDPQSISLEVTHHCMSRCVMCNIWKFPSSVQDLPLEKWIGLLSEPGMSSLREIDITGGEPFLRRDLAELVQAIAELKDSILPDLKGVAITTNGYLTKRILRMSGQMVEALNERGIDLVFACAMDGVGAAHNRIRRLEHMWENLDATIAGLLDLRNRYPNLIIGIKTTILPQNIGELDRILDYAETRGLFTIISPRIVTNNRYANSDIEDSLRFTRSDKDAMIRFFQSDRFRWSYHRTMMLQYLLRGAVRKPCAAGHSYYFVRSFGEVYPCPIIKWPIGNIRERTFDDLMRTPQARRFRRRVGTFQECKTCTEPGLERYGLPCEGFTYARMLMTMGREDFQTFHTHMGLNKYL